jgi:hypothetical protein
MIIKSKTGGASIAVNRRVNGGLAITQGPSHLLVTVSEWRAVADAVELLLHEPQVSA